MVAQASSELHYIVPELLLECLDARIQPLVYSRLEDLGNHLLVIYTCGDEQRYQIREVGPSRACTTLAQAVKVAPPGYSARYLVRCFAAPTGVVPPGVAAAPCVPYALARVVLLSDNPAETISSTRLPFPEATETPAPKETAKASKAEIRPPSRQSIALPVAKKASTQSDTAFAVKTSGAVPVPAEAPKSEAAAVAQKLPEPQSESTMTPSVSTAAPAQLRQGIQDFRKALESRETDLRNREKALESKDAELKSRASELDARDVELNRAEAVQVEATKALAKREAELEAARKSLSDKEGLLAAAERDLAARVAACDAKDAELAKREAADAEVERTLVERNEALEKEIAGLLSLLQEFSGDLAPEKA